MSRSYALWVAAVVSGALLLLWWAPWSSPVPVITRARQAFGNERVVHVVASPGIDRNAPAMRPIGSSESIEVWYDPSRQRTHVVVRRGTKVTLDNVEQNLEPPNVSPLGQVSPQLWKFVSGYASTLTDGKYHVDGSARIEGRRVLWLSAPTHGDAVDVAVDPVSYRAIWLRSSDSTFLTQVAMAETKPYDPADFLTAKQKKPRHL